MNKNKALIIVDYQYDFVADNGALTVGKAAQDIQEYLENLADGYAEEDIFFTFDDHDIDDWKNKKTPESEVFNEHCINGTNGYQIYGNIKGKIMFKTMLIKKRIVQTKVF